MPDWTTGFNDVFSPKRATTIGSNEMHETFAKLHEAPHGQS